MIFIKTESVIEFYPNGRGARQYGYLGGPGKSLHVPAWSFLSTSLGMIARLSVLSVNDKANGKLNRQASHL